MVKKIQHAVMALVMASGLMASATPQAEARHGRGVALGVAAGIIGLGVLGAARAHADDRYYSDYDEDACYYGPRECHWTGRRCFENSWGDEVCRGGRYVCERPLVCD
mgnify:FL=1